MPIRLSCDDLLLAVGTARKKDEFLAWAVRGVADVDDLKAMLIEIPFNLMAFSEAQCRRRGHNLVTQSRVCLEGTSGRATSVTVLETTTDVPSGRVSLVGA